MLAESEMKMNVMPATVIISIFAINGEKKVKRSLNSQKFFLAIQFKKKKYYKRENG